MKTCVDYLDNGDLRLTAGRSKNGNSNARDHRNLIQGSVPNNKASAQPSAMINVGCWAAFYELTEVRGVLYLGAALLSICIKSPTRASRIDRRVTVSNRGG